MSTWVVDASVVVKWFVPENESPRAVRLLESEDRFLAPDLLSAELTNILWKKVRVGELDPADARLILRGAALVGIESTPCSDLSEGALEIAMATGRSAYDSIYVALAVLTGVRLVTADQRLAAALANTPFAAHIVDLRHLPLQ